MKIKSKNLFYTDKLRAFLMIVTVLILGITAITAVLKTGLSIIEFRNEQEMLISEISKSESGRYAADKFFACMKSGTILSKNPTSASCSAEAVNSAKILHGESYSINVRDAVLKLDALYSKRPN